MNAPLITLDRIAVRQRDRWLLEGLSWCIRAGEQWVITGSNGAGKTTLAKAIAGRLPVVQGRIHYHGAGVRAPMDAIAYVASDARRDIWRAEQTLALSRDFAGRLDDATLTEDFLNAGRVNAHGAEPSERGLAHVAESCNVAHLLDRPLLALSTGELSRVLIARSLLAKPRMLILDEPFEGLDASGRRLLGQMLDRLAAGGLPILLITHRTEERLATTTHLLELADGRIHRSGPVPPVEVAVEKRPAPVVTMPAAMQWPESEAPRPQCRNHGTAIKAGVGAPLIDMRAVTVRYGDLRVLDRVDWTVHEGEHWAVSGPNGAGKSTLLKLITGDCLQVYANRIRLFGCERGPCQPLAVVRRQLGVVSHALAAAYQKAVSALDVVCSGFFDSVGIYRHCSQSQRDAARWQLVQMGVAELAQVPFNHLSQGQRQLVLIARAMVKTPRLLLLDEPLSGLDPKNRQRVLSLLTAIGTSGNTGLITVSHQCHEIPSVSTHHLMLTRGRVVYRGLFRPAG